MEPANGGMGIGGGGVRVRLEGRQLRLLVIFAVYW